MQIIYFLLLPLALLTSSCLKVRKNNIANQKLEIIPVLRGKKLIVNYSENGNRKAKMHIELLEKYKKPVKYIEMRKGVHVDFYDSLDNINSTIDAKYAKQMIEDGIVILKNDVVITNDKNQILETEFLEWNQKNKTIYSDKFVKITNKEEILTGYGLQAKDDMSEYKINNIQGVINSEKITPEN